jgi:hypothetical protein
MTTPPDPPQMSRSARRRLRWAINRERDTSSAVDRWIVELARGEGRAPAPRAPAPRVPAPHVPAPHPVLDQLLVQLGQILAVEGDSDRKGGFRGETGHERSVAVPASLLSAIHQELSQPSGPGETQAEVEVGALEALTAALGGGATEAGWARSEATRVLAELLRSGWLLAQAPLSSEGTEAT